MGSNHHQHQHQPPADRHDRVRDRFTLTFLGAAGTVTGSKYLLTLGRRRVLVDAGMFQGEREWRRRNWDPFPVDPATIGDVLLTHAHLDHCGYLPALVRAGFNGPIWCTAGTRALVEIVLRDAAHLQEQDAQHAMERGYSKHDDPQALYGIRDVERTLPLFRVVDFDEDVDLGGEGVQRLWMRMTRAGHILGSASVRVSFGPPEWERSVLFSGDLGRHDHPLLRAREVPRGASYVVVESTYGDREHPENQAPHEAFADAIRRTAKRGGSVLVPAFAIDRTEVVLKALAQMRRDDRIPDLPIYVNSPMGIAALRVYREAAGDGELRPDLDVEGVLGLQNLHEARTKEESMALNNPRMPSVIISSSGMATGGRVLHHLEHMLPDDRNTVVLTGYQSVGTRGRALADGAQQLKLYGEYVPVRAEIVTDDEFSVHADASELLDWLRELRPAPRTCFVAHGEDHAAQALADAIHTDLGWTAVVPAHGEVVRIPG